MKRGRLVRRRQDAVGRLALGYHGRRRCARRTGTRWSFSGPTQSGKSAGVAIPNTPGMGRPGDRLVDQARPVLGDAIGAARPRRGDGLRPVRPGAGSRHMVAAAARGDVGRRALDRTADGRGGETDTTASRAAASGPTPPSNDWRRCCDCGDTAGRDCGRSLAGRTDPAAPSSTLMHRLTETAAATRYSVADAQPASTRTWRSRRLPGRQARDRATVQMLVPAYRSPPVGQLRSRARLPANGCWPAPTRCT